MKELSLFSGAGGGLLGTMLLGWKHIGYVEWNDYCQQVLKRRIEDGILSPAPIFSDIKAFNDEGFAASYTGLVDVITGGFPCQPFSISGSRKAENDERNMWPETIRTIRTVKPKFCFLENVTGLLHSYFGQVLRDLAESGYNVRWKMLSAGEVGAPHLRDRVFIFAYSNQTQFERGSLPIRIFKKHPNFSYTCWGEDKSGMVRNADGVAYQMDRLESIGNGQVPQVVATAWQILSEGIV